LATLAGAAWLYRLPLADRAARDWFARAGVDADFELADAGPSGVVVRGLRVGAETAPDAVAGEAAFGIGWGLTGPRLDSVRLKSAALRVRIDGEGVSFGTLDSLLPDGDAGREARIPPIAIEIADGRLLLLTPAGAFPASVNASGRLTRDFAAAADIAPVTRPDGSAENVRARVRARTDDGATIIDFDGGADRLAAEPLAARALRFDGRLRLPPDLAGIDGKLALAADSLTSGRLQAEFLRLDTTIGPGAGQRLRAEAALTAQAIDGDGLRARDITAGLTAAGDLRQAHGTWSWRSGATRAGSLVAPEAAGAGEYTFDGRAAAGAVVAATGRLTLTQAGLDENGRRRVLAAAPDLAGSPAAGLMASGKIAVDRALTRFSTAAAVALDWRGGAGRLAAPGPIVVDAASGGRLTAKPADPGRPVLLALLPSGALEGAAHLTLEGGGLPPATLTLDRFRLAGAETEAVGAVSVTDWRTPRGRLDLARTTFALRGDAAGGSLSVDGALDLDGRSEAVSVSGFRAPLKLEARWGGGYQVRLPDRCIPAAIGALEFAGHIFRPQNGGLSLCARPDGLLAAADASGKLDGGFSVNEVTLAGRTADNAARPARLAAARIEGRLTGGRRDGHLALAATAPRYAIDFAADRRIAFDGALITARTAPGGRVVGDFRDGVLMDPALPANVRSIWAKWSAGPEHGRTIIRIADGAARVTDKPPPIGEGSTADDDAPPPRFNPLRIAGVEGSLSDGRILADGDILLEDGGRQLARFDASHDLASGAGKAHVTNPALQFSRDLDLYKITELARGVVDHVNGPVGVALIVSWTGDGLVSRGVLSPREVNLNAAALGPVEGITGDVAFNDLFALTTEPGQNLSIRRLNPGVAVENGEIRFQVLAPDRVLIEGASWPFAAGKLSVAPQLVLVGEDEFRMTLSLSDVDVQQLLQQLDFKDLTATGRMEGTLPLIFTRDGGRIVGGRLQAAEGGGAISYTGNAGAGLAGAPQIAFDALKAFAYDNLVIELDGELDGEIVSAIRFSGENVQPIGGIVAPGALPVPGVERLKVTGWPFRFTVAVRAPFRRLAQTSAGINDARPLVDEAIRSGPTQPAPVDPQKPAPR
jgi:hypothetical protein